MPLTEKQKAHQKKYRQTPGYKAKEKARQQTPEYKAQQKEWKQTPAGIKSNRISKWKYSGIICDDWDTLYERYLNTEFCEDCKCELTEDKNNTSTTRCLDHCHETREVRNIVCHACNVKRG